MASQQTTHEPTRTTTLANEFVRFLGDYVPPAGVFADDLVTECNFPHTRFRLEGVEEMLAMVRADSPDGSSRVRDVRVDLTTSGFAVEFEQTLKAGGTFQELVRADVRDGRIAKIAWYCTGVLAHHH